MKVVGKKETLTLNTNTLNIGQLFSDEYLIAFLLSRNEILEAADIEERCSKHYEIVIGIGKDHVAYLTLDEEALWELMKRMRGLKEYNENPKI